MSDHLEHGAVYASRVYRALESTLCVRSSMGRTVVCRDNAATQTFFAAFKNECFYRAIYVTKGKARQTQIDTSKVLVSRPQAFRSSDTDS